MDRQAIPDIWGKPPTQGTKINQWGMGNTETMQKAEENFKDTTLIASEEGKW